MKIKINSDAIDISEALETIKGFWETNRFYALAVRADRRNMEYMEEFGNSHQWFQDDPDDGTPYNEDEDMGYYRKYADANGCQVWITYAEYGRSKAGLPVVLEGVLVG